MLDAAAQGVAGQQRQVHFHVLGADHALEAVALLDRDALEFVAVTCSVFTTFTGVALAADAVHGYRQCRVGFGGDGAQGHGAGREALDDFFGGLDFFQRNRLGGIHLELEQAAQRQVALGLVVDDLGVLFVGIPVVGAGGVLQLGNRIRGPHVLFTTGAPGVFAAGIQGVGQHGAVAEGQLVHADGLFRDLEHADTFHLAGGAGEVLVDGFGVQADGFEQLGTAVRHVGRHAHLGHDLGQALADRLDVVVDGLFSAQVARQLLVDALQGFHGEVGVHGFCTVTRQHCEMVHLAGGTGFDHQTCCSAQTFTHQMLVNGRQGQQRRDSDLGRADAAVADDQDVVAALDGVNRLGAQGSQLGFHTFMAPGQGIGDVEGVATELALGVVLDVAHLGHVGKVQHRLAHLQAHRRVHLVDVQQVGLGSNKGHQRHHDRFADRVDRRVGHLGKQLLEVAVERLVFVRQDGQGAVVAHGTDRLFTGCRHRRDQELQVFLGEAEGLLAVQQAHLVGDALGLDARHHGRQSAVGTALVKGDVVELDAQVLNPLLVGLAVGEAGFELLVIDHAALLQVNQEHLAGLQAPFAHDFVFRHGQHAGLGAHDDQVVIGDAVAGRTQAVAVQRGADLATIGEYDRGRAVPRLHHRCVVFVEGLAALVHGGVLLPWLGDHHHHGLADGVARHGQQLKAVVESGGVGLVCKADGVQLLQIGSQHGGRHHAFAGLHPVVVAFNGVDFTVVRHVAIRVSQWPLGEGVGGEALVHQAQGRHATGVFQILKVHTHLVGQQQALVDHGAAGHAGHVILFGVGQAQCLDVGAGGLADHVQLALQRVLHDHVVATADEDLAQDRFFGAHGGRHGHIAVHRHIAPTQQHLAFRLDGAFHFLLASEAGGVLFGQEDHADAVFALGRQGHALLGHFFAVQRIRQLNQDTGAIAHQCVCAYCAAMVQVFEDLECIFDDVMALLAPDVRDKTDAAGIVLIRVGIQTVVFEILDFGCRGHGALLKIAVGLENTATQQKCQDF